MKHYAWDGGAIYGALDSVFGKGASVIVRSKTTKTVCGKTTKSDNIDNDNPTCEGCLTSLSEGEAMMEEIQKYLMEVR